MVWQGDEQGLLWGCTGRLCFELGYQVARLSVVREGA